MIRRGKKDERQTRIDSTIYAWRGRPQASAPIVYVYIHRCADDAVSIASAVRQSGITRTIVLAELVRKNPPRSLRAFYEQVATIWDELLPPTFRVAGEYPTHFLEVGLHGANLPRSAFFETALCLNVIGRDAKYADYCAIEIGGFLQWQFGTWTKADFDGAALDEKPAITWVLQCIFSKWKSLR